MYLLEIDYICHVINKYKMAKMDINRLKVVLAKKKEPTNGWQNNMVKTLLLFQSGALTLLSQDWKL